MSQLLIVLFVILGGGNTLLTLRQFKGGKRFSSIPLVGGLCGGIGFWTFGPPLAAWWWVPFVLDYGCIPHLIVSGVFLAKRHRG